MALFFSSQTGVPLMKIVAIILSMSLLLVGCSSGKTRSEVESQVADSEEVRDDTDISISVSTNMVAELPAEENERSYQEAYTHVNAGTTVLDVVNHPAFKGFGQFIFPIGSRMPDAGMTLDRISSLLPYHQNINPDTTVRVVNYMLDEVAAGRTIFYDIYSDEEKQYDPSKEDTGLFFFRGEPGAPFAIVSTGGGFSYVGSIHESYPHAIELSEKGYNAFAIQYRTGGAQVACEDLAAALTFVFDNAELLGVSTDNYSLWGGSAGARMAAYLGSYGAANYGGEDLPRPSAVIMQYTSHTDYTANDPPTYAVIGENDGIASWG